MPADGPTDFYVDTNLIVRLVTGDPPDLAQVAQRVFERAAGGDITLHLTAMVVAESVYVLTSFYGLPRNRVAKAIHQVIDLPGLKVAEASQLSRCLELFANNTSLHLVDAYLIAQAEVSKRGVASFDSAIQKMQLVPVLTFDEGV